MLRLPQHLILKGLYKMYTSYNRNQLTFDLSTSFSFSKRKSYHCFFKWAGRLLSGQWALSFGSTNSVWFWGYDEVGSFCVSNDVRELTNKGLDQLTEYLCARNLIDDAFFVDETKIWRMWISTALSGRITRSVSINESRKTGYHVNRTKRSVCYETDSRRNGIEIRHSRWILDT